MANFKEIWVYTQLDKGFEEVYYSTADNIGDAAAIPQNLIGPCLKMRHPTVVLRKIRISDVLDNRSTQIVNVNQPGTGTAGLLGPEATGVAAIYTLNAPSTAARRNVWFRGLCDQQVGRDPSTGIDQPGQELQQAAKQFILKLSANVYQIRSLTKISGADPFKKYPVTRIGVNNDGTVTLMGASINLVPQTGGQIKITGVNPKQFAGLQGAFDFTATVAGQVNVNYTCALPVATYVQTKAFIRYIQYEYGQIVPGQNDFLKFGTRDTGKNSLGGRGRKPGLRIRSVSVPVAT